MSSNYGRLSIAYAEQGASIALSNLLSTSRYWDAGELQFKDISEASPSALYAYVLSSDAASNVSVTQVSLTVADRTPPQLGGAAVLTQIPAANTFACTGVSARELRATSLEMGLLLSSASSLSDATVVQLYKAGSNVTKNLAVANATRGDIVSLPSISSASNLYTGSTWRQVNDDADISTVYGYLVVSDGSVCSVARAPATGVIDVTPPAFSGISIPTATASTLQLNWAAVADGRDPAPKLFVAAYASAQPSITAATVRAGTGAVSRVAVNNASSTTAYSYGSGALGEAALTEGATCYVYAFAEDAVGNRSAVYSAAKAPDGHAPTFASFTATGSADLISFAWSVSDNVGVSNVAVGTADPGAGSGNIYNGTASSATWTTTNYATQTFYARAIDAAGNTSSLVTASAAAVSPRSALSYMINTGVNSGYNNSEMIFNTSASPNAAYSLSSAAALGGSGSYSLTVTFGAKAQSGRTGTLNCNCLVGGGTVNNLNIGNVPPPGGTNYTITSNYTVAAGSSVQFVIVSYTNLYSVFNLQARWTPI